MIETKIPVAITTGKRNSRGSIERSEVKGAQKEQMNRSGIGCLGVMKKEEGKSRDDNTRHRHKGKDEREG